PKRQLRRRLDGRRVIYVPHDEIEQRLLALDVEVDGTLRDSEGSGDVGHLGAAIALVDEDIRRGVHQIDHSRTASVPSHYAANTKLTDLVSQALKCSSLSRVMHAPTTRRSPSTIFGGRMAAARHQTLKRPYLRRFRDGVALEELLEGAIPALRGHPAEQ